MTRSMALCVGGPADSHMFRVALMAGDTLAVRDFDAHYKASGRQINIEGRLLDECLHLDGDALEAHLKEREQIEGGVR